MTTPETAARLADYAEQKFIENTRPGWWIQAWDEDGTDSWVRVSYVASVVHNETGRKATVVRAVDQEGLGVELREWNGTPVTALTAAKAKRAGLGKEASGGAA